jgi:xylulokinase
MAWIAVDAGTSVIKAVVFTDDGREFALCRENTTIQSPQPGFAEQDMNSVWAAVVSTIRRVNQQIPEPIQGLVITAQGDGSWLVDGNGYPTGSAILWNDGRAAEIVNKWHNDGIIRQAFRTSGSVTYPGLSNAIFHWLAENEPDRIDKARWSLTCNGWLFSKLTSRFLADLSDGSNPFSNVITATYSSDLLSLYGLEDRTHLLPPIHGGDDLVSSLTAVAAEQLGLPTSTPVIMAPYDIVTTAYGCGSASAGQACVILGTTICAEVITSSLNLNAAPTGTTIALGNGSFLRAMPTLTGCEALTWTANALSCESIQELDRLAATAAPGSNGLLFFPYLSLAGERAPFLEPSARGSFIGLSLAHGRSDLARSVYEGLAFVIRECLNAATDRLPSEIRVCGGGARSDLWCQIIADVVGAPIVRTDDSEVGARGAFLFALVATGAASSIQDAIRQHVAPAKTFFPSPDLHQLYSERFDLFLQQRDLSLPQWRLNKGRA